MSSLPEVVVRDALPEERDTLLDLTLAAYAQYAAIMTPPAWGGLRDAIISALSTENDAQRIVAVRERSLLGSVLLFPPLSNAYFGMGQPLQWPELRLLAVTPEARGLGIGTLLLAECVRRARDTGAGAIGLHTSSSMREAIRLYEHAGFSRDPGSDILLEGAERIEAYRLALPPLG